MVRRVLPPVVIALLIAACSPVASDPEAQLLVDSNVCNAGYAGPTCAICATGYQDRNGNGHCSPSCAVTSCGEHERCDDESGRAVCRCVAGYLREDSQAGCVFRGGPRDPSFSDGEKTAWRMSGDVYFDPTISTHRFSGFDPGWAGFTGRGAVYQSFDMPSRADSESFAMDIVAGCGDGGCGNVRNTLAIMLGDRGFDISLFNNFTDGLTKHHICLGDAAYGRRLTLAARTWSAVQNFTSREDAYLDHLRFGVAAECPAPGTIVNGDFDEKDSWWEGRPADDNVLLGMTLEGGGTNGSKAGYLEVANQDCRGTALVTKASIPEKLSRPAISFSVEGPSNTTTFLLLGRLLISSFTNKGAGRREKAIVCVPEWARGFVHDLEIRARIFDETACANLDKSTVIVDDFKLTSDASCPEDPNVLDGSFEAKTPWQSRFDPYGGSGPTGSRVIVSNPSEAHSGSSFARLVSSCSPSDVGQTIFVPVATKHPAVRFWYRQRRASKMHGVSAVLGDVSADLLPATEWTERVLCVPPWQAGRALLLGFSIWPVDFGDKKNGDDFSCPDEHIVDIDDVSVSYDPSCPSE